MNKTAILNERRGYDGCVEYKVLFHGYADNFGLWEPASNFRSYPELLEAWSSLRETSSAREVIEADILLDVAQGSISETSFADPARANGKRSLRVDDAADFSSGSDGSKVKRIRKRSAISSGASSNGTDVPLAKLVSSGKILSTRERVKIVPASRASARPATRPGSAAIARNTDTAQYQAFVRKLAAVPGPPVTLFNSENDIPSPNPDFEFINELRLGAGVPDYPSEFIYGCSCSGNECKDPSKCLCTEDLPAKDRKNWPYSRHGFTTRKDNCDAIVECNSKCSCGMGCVNRNVQKGRTIPLEIFMTAGKGWGLRCPQNLRKGQFVETYLGEVITRADAVERCIGYQRTNLSYLFDLDKYGKDYDNYTIDSMDCGNVARFINHSCNPNLCVFAVASERKDREVYDLALFTDRFIPAGTELTFSYTLPNSKRNSLKLARSTKKKTKNVDDEDEDEDDEVENDSDEADSDTDDDDDDEDEDEDEEEEASIGNTAGDDSGEERMGRKTKTQKAVAAARLSKPSKSDKWRCHCGARNCVGYLWT